MELLTKENPGKVCSLLVAAFASMFFLFAVTVTNASFERTETTFPDVFSPAKVVSVLDNVSNSYSKFLAVNLIEPAKRDYGFYADNLAYVAQEAGPEFMQETGLGNLGQQLAEAVSIKPQVAGASTQVVYSKYYPTSEGVFSIFYK